MKSRQTGISNQKKQNGSSRFWRSLIIGILSGALTALLLTVLCAWITAKFHVPVTALHTLSAICWVFGSFTAGLAAGMLLGQKGLLIGLIGGGVWLVLLAGGNLILFGMKFELLTLIKAVLGVLLCALGGVLGAKLIRKKEKHRYTY